MATFFIAYKEHFVFNVHQGQLVLNWHLFFPIQGVMQQEINSLNSDDLSSSSQHNVFSAATRVNIQFVLISFILINYSQ